jgi:hypothetical protein
MLNVTIALADIIDKVPNSCNINDGWVVKKMKLEYVNRIVTILPIIYQKNMAEYFNNKSANNRLANKCNTTNKGIKHTTTDYEQNKESAFDTIKTTIYA